MKLRQLWAVAMCFVLVAGAAWLPSTAGDADDQESLEQALRATQRERVKSAERALEAVEAAYAAETLTIEGLVDATRNLAEAQVDAATKPEEEIAAWTRYVKVAKGAEERVKALHDLASRGGEVAAYYTAKQERERAEIALLKARLKAAKR